jgi:uncharacterized membrane protein
VREKLIQYGCLALFFAVSIALSILFGNLLPEIPEPYATRLNFMFVVLAVWWIVKTYADGIDRKLEGLNARLFNIEKRLGGSNG